MSDIVKDISDMKSIRGEYVRLIRREILNCLNEVNKKYTGKSVRTLEDIVQETAIRCYDITLADFSSGEVDF